jgi:hypothetical protein
MLADVMSGNADMIATSLDIGIQRSLVVDYLPQISSDYAALIIINDKNFDELEFDTYFHPFSNQFWLIIILIAFCISILVQLHYQRKKIQNGKFCKKCGHKFLRFWFYF